MRDWIAGSAAVLGVLLVLAGGTLKVLSALAAARPGGGDDGPAPARPDAGDAWPSPRGDNDETQVVPAVPARRRRGSAIVRAVHRLPEADGLIAWGIVLLLLGAIAAGAISFSFGADAGTR